MISKKRKSSFFPIADLRDKQNFKLYDIIEKNGTILERVFLDLPSPCLREKVILIHYLSRRVKLFLKEHTAFSVLSRDNPWDFRVDLSNGDQINVEITSIAEDHSIFKLLTSEEYYSKFIRSQNITLREAISLNRYFPNEKLAQLINYSSNNLNPQEVISNPMFGQQILTIGEIGDKLPDLSELLSNAIQKKQMKKHAQKESTVLIIDNRTFRYEIHHVKSALEQLSTSLSQSPFMEIWFYTGYYSTLDGNDAEYSLVPIKITLHQEKILTELVKMRFDNDSGIIFC